MPMLVLGPSGWSYEGDYVEETCIGLLMMRREAELHGRHGFGMETGRLFVFESD